MQLRLISLRHSGKTVKMAQNLYSVGRLNVVHSVAEHVQKRVKYAPGVSFENCWQQMTWNQRFDSLKKKMTNQCQFSLKAVGTKN